MEEKSRTVEECCEGYMRMIHGTAETNARCLPFCERCLAGACVAPNECQCNPGYRGEDCSLECPPGSWGLRCMDACNCGEDGACDAVNGTCRCSPGRRGLRCEEACAIGRWGPNCANECTCQKRHNDCDAVTGRCIDDDDDDDDDDVVSSVEETSPVYSRSERPQTSRISNVNYEGLPAPRETTERQTKDDWDNTDYVPETTTAVSASSAIPSQTATMDETRGGEPSTTTQPVIVLVSVPERKRDVEKNRQKLPTKDAFLGHIQSDEVSDIDYVKTIRKDDVRTATPIPLDIALIVMAAIVSLGLTSLAVVMVLHMRSKLFETLRLAVYDDAKGRERESANAGRMSTIIDSALPPPPIGAAHPGPTGNAEAILMIDDNEPLNAYANSAAAIGLRISANLRDLLRDGHYDRPPMALICLQTDLDHNAEHVYDEIPLQTTPRFGHKDL